MAGYITVFTGEMFSGKSEALEAQVRTAVNRGAVTQVFYPEQAARASQRDIAHRLREPHPNLKLTPVPQADAEWLLRHVVPDADVVAIDEAQFFTPAIVSVLQQLRMRGLVIYVAGLDQDYRGNPFGPMGQILCIANQIHKLHARCARCGASEALFSQRVVALSDQIVIGDTIYQPVCEDCYHLAGAVSLAD
ncbi:thymidine kinase [Sulfobacillus acidophilus TPY]|uniref:Thymidine kinase n=1 Tax=Sulfobacillus acidophilus (strain ATCC 700253 / DSM 10332 / NAL) TaxID=679936 RepID=G8TTV2_SULAD|nr:thymidine kinase [Sulfobacillus acidophilus TPY]AEW04543.1 Thymidine kinase [Sulfobacillus acidophilus DSM 10332]